ncbi:hypothetical protein D3C73_1156020 [compost metagenome]
MNYTLYEYLKGVGRNEDSLKTDSSTNRYILLGNYFQTILRHAHHNARNDFEICDWQEDYYLQLQAILSAFAHVVCIFDLAIEFLKHFQQQLE